VIRKLVAIFLILAAMIWIAPVATAGTNRYAVGQIWEYKSRPQDAGSLVKINAIETMRFGKARLKIFHIGLIGLSFAGSPGGDALPHAPASAETLDKSVTRRIKTAAIFPSFDEGIAEWRRAKGGVFTISLAEIADIIDKTVSGQQP
jgi:hypothetical protein